MINQCNWWINPAAQHARTTTRRRRKKKTSNASNQHLIIVNVNDCGSFQTRLLFWFEKLEQTLTFTSFYLHTQTKSRENPIGRRKFALGKTAFLFSNKLAQKLFSFFIHSKSSTLLQFDCDSINRINSVKYRKQLISAMDKLTKITWTKRNKTRTESCFFWPICWIFTSVRDWFVLAFLVPLHQFRIVVRRVFVCRRLWIDWPSM